jgi:hypothetical protein
VRFVFVDRVLVLDPGRSIETLKNVTATEDVFADHFPGYPVFPGALIVETFEQASQLLIVATHAFACVGRLRAVRRGAFRHFVRPGDQLRVRCARTGGDDATWTPCASRPPRSNSGWYPHPVTTPPRTPRGCARRCACCSRRRSRCRARAGPHE